MDIREDGQDGTEDEQLGGGGGGLQRLPEASTSMRCSARDT